MSTVNEGHPSASEKNIFGPNGKKEKCRSLLSLLPLPLQKHTEKVRILFASFLSFVVLFSRFTFSFTVKTKARKKRNNSPATKKNGKKNNHNRRRINKITVFSFPIFINKKNKEK